MKRCWRTGILAVMALVLLGLGSMRSAADDQGIAEFKQEGAIRICVDPANVPLSSEPARDR